MRVEQERPLRLVVKKMDGDGLSSAIAEHANLASPIPNP